MKIKKYKCAYVRKCDEDLFGAVMDKMGIRGDSSPNIIIIPRKSVDEMIISKEGSKTSLLLKCITHKLESFTGDIVFIK